MSNLLRLFLLGVALAAPVVEAGAQAVPRPPSPAPSIAERTRGLRRMDGFVPLYWDGSAGKLFLEVPFFDRDLLYVVSLPAGIGSNDVGLDRSQLGGERVVRFERIGPKVLLVEPNQRYRALSPDAAERRAVEESFARSVLWGFTVEAESDGRVLVDATEFALRDAHGVIATLRRSRQGTYRLDGSRSALYLPATKAFPQNSEIEATLTFTGEDPGSWVRDVTPTPEAITVRERQSFVELPPPGFEPLRFDPRAGFIPFVYVDYAAPLGQPIEQRFVLRHRLQKRDPAAAASPPVTPIVYYVDPGAPEPVRTALLEGARWWGQAFDAAGYQDAFRVEILPDSADPMDVRYNVIQWVHRATRGWSYGATITDPRTGEILKGHVSLGSLRVRQDYLLAEGLLAPYARGDERAAEAEAMALARIRQLAAHEVGHTLGLQHNYLASTAGRASVMDYPHPLARLGPGGAVDLSDAYAAGIGAWDRVAIVWGYQDFPPGTDGATAREAGLTRARTDGLTFLSDQDARPPGSTHPQTHLWDNGADAVEELGRVMAVRQAALERFGDAAIRRGLPLATLEEALVPLYLHHRYQVEAATKAIGGQWYVYALRGDGQEPVRPVDPREQRRALEAVLATLRPEALAFPRALLARIPPRPSGFPAHRELFQRETGLVFDAITPAAAASDFVVSFLLDEERAARLVQQHALDPSQPGLEEVLDRLIGAAFEPPAPDPPRVAGYEEELGRTVQRVVTDRVVGLAAGAGMPQVRALAAHALDGLGRRLTDAATRGSTADRAHRESLAADIGRFFRREYDGTRPLRPPPLPPGMPIGDVEPDGIPPLRP